MKIRLFLVTQKEVLIISENPALKKTKEMEEYEIETGNYAIWNNEITDGFLKWKKEEKNYDKDKEKMS